MNFENLMLKKKKRKLNAKWSKSDRKGHMLYEYHWYEMSSTGRPIETENRFVLPGLAKRLKINVSRLTKLLLGVIKLFCN